MDLDAQAKPEVRAGVAELVARARSAGELAPDGYCSRDYDGFLRDLGQTVEKRWALLHVREHYCNDWGRFVQELAAMYDKYVPELLELLVPPQVDKPERVKLYRSALYQINTIRGLRRYLDPDDALQQTWVTIMGDKLRIVEFTGTGSLKTWVQRVLRNEILQVARHHRIVESA